LLKVRGQPLIERHVVNLARAGIARIVINLAWLGSQIRDYLGDGARYGVTHHSTAMSRRARSSTGGGHLSRAAVSCRRGRSRWSTATSIRISRSRRWKLPPIADAHLVLVPNPPQHPQGRLWIGAGRPCRRPRASYTFSGIAVYRQAFFAGCRTACFP
jgi:MurNAc alpha-1-phosphate uridylyltransferase